jgi:hypothetical protein
MNNFPRVCLLCISNYCDLFTRTCLKRLNKTTYKSIPKSNVTDLIAERSKSVLQFFADFFKDFKKMLVKERFSPILTFNDRLQVCLYVAEKNHAVESIFHDVALIDLFSSDIMVHDPFAEDFDKITNEGLLLYRTANLTLDKMNLKHQQLLNFYPSEVSKIKSHFFADVMFMTRMHFYCEWAQQVKSIAGKK